MESTYGVAAVIFAWPAVFASVVLTGMGVVRGCARLSVTGAILACPFLAYTSGAPALRWLSIISGALLFLGAAAVAQRQRWVAIALMTPYVGLCGWIARAALRQAG